MSLQLKNNSPFPEDQKGGILIMDSGIGSLSFLSSLNELLPDVPLIAFADQAFFPYGEKEENVIVERILNMAEQLVSWCEPSTILIACNTASTIVLPALREKFHIPIVGVVPAIKTAAALTKSKKIALLATNATVTRPYIDDLVNKFAGDCDLLKIGSAYLASIAEEKILSGKVDIEAVRDELDLLIKTKDIDSLVLGCTHFTFLINEIKEIIGQDITIVDPVLPVSTQVLRVNTSIKREAAHNYLVLSSPEKRYLDLDLLDYGIHQVFYL